MTERTRLIEELRWKKFPVLNDGFVCLVDVMGDDAAITQAARVSYGNDTRLEDRTSELGCVPRQHSGLKEQEAEKIKKDDRGLIRYLMRHRHTTPFEMAEVKILVRVPMDCWRQWIRHRTASVNEYSTRYTEAIDSQQTTKPDEWRLQAKNNKQGSQEGELQWPESGPLCDLTGNWAGPKQEDGDGSGYESVGEYLSTQETEFQVIAEQVYQSRLACGVAKEQARKDLPLSTYTEAYWKCDLHNILGFLSLRMDSHAQKEIRDYATIIGEQIIKPLFPLVWEAFEDYRLGGLFLSRLDIQAVNEVADVPRVMGWVLPKEEAFEETLNKIFNNKREREECVAKLKRLGLVE